MNGRQPTVSDAIIALGIDGGFKIRNGKIAKWYVNDPQPSEEEIQTKLTELRNAEPMRLLREERNKKLSETDWTQNRDVTLTNDSLVPAFTGCLKVGVLSLRPPTVFRLLPILVCLSLLISSTPLT